MIVFQTFRGEKLPPAHDYPYPFLRWHLNNPESKEWVGPANKPLEVVEFKRTRCVDDSGLDVWLWVQVSS
jgi:hypothetical protein